MISNSFCKIIVFFCFFGYSQNSDSVKGILDSKDTLEEKIRSIDSVIQVKTSQRDFEALDHLYTTYARWLYSKKKYKKVIEASKLGLKNQHNLLTIDTILWQRKLYFLGLGYYRMKEYDASISTFQEHIIHYKEGDITAKAYSELGRCYKDKGDYHNAIKHYKLGASLLSKQKNWRFLLVNYINTTQAFSRLETTAGYKESIAYFLKADSLANQISANDFYRYYIKLGLGKSYNQNINFNAPKALAYYKEALLIAEKRADSSRLEEIYHQLGNLYNTIDPDRGIEYHNKAIGYTRNDALQSFYNNINIAYCYTIKEEHDKGIFKYLDAIGTLAGIDDIHLKSAIDVSLFYGIDNKASLVNVLKNLSKAYYKKYLATNDINSIHKTINTYMVADELLDIVRIESGELKSKLFWRKQSSELYGRAIEACFLAKDVDKAFYFMEKNKALLLTEDVRNAQLRQSIVLPDSLVDKEILLKKSIYNLTHQKPTKENKDSLAIAVLNEQRKLRDLQNSIKESFSEYKVVDYKTSVISLKALQESLDDNTAVIEYNISAYDDYGLITPVNGYTPVIKDCKYGVKTHHPSYGLLITKNTIDFFEIEGKETLQEDLQKVITKMSKPFKTDQETKDYNELSNVVFKKLFPSEKVRATIKNKKLRIIPDNNLNYLSFEALVTSIHANDNPEYLIQNTEVSYGYSNSFLASISVNTENTENSFLAFAPGTYEAQQLLPLITSEEEISTIHNYFEGATYTQEKATKERFLTTFSNYDIVHLATHADAQDSISPWIAFRKNKLLEDELYLTTNKAKLVVLSGCNTLLGKQETGEGVMSLARGFFYSGAASVVSSLWSVNDRSTSYIMNEFYKNLSNDQSKSEALRNAKLSYLENHMFGEASPSYWASLVLLGDSNTLHTSSHSKYWWFLVLPILLLVYFIYKKRRNS